ASPDPLEDFEQINTELALFSPKLAEKPQIVVLNKTDLPETEQHWETIKARADELGWPVFKISAVAQQGLQPLIGTLFEKLEELPREELFEEIPIFTLDEDPNLFHIEVYEDGWRVTGPRIEQLAAQTYWESDEAIVRAFHILEKMGVHAALQAEGVSAGDTVYLDEVELEWAW
ncbi:MAG: Obg family GTPase CgtA, partial [Chloroflexota bacterium]